MILLMAVAGGGDTTPVEDLRPSTVDPVVLSMRPAGRLLDTLVVGDGGDYQTIGDAMLAAKSIQDAQLLVDGATKLSPHYRVDVLVRAGNYIENVKIPAWVGLYGDGADVVTLTQSNTSPLLGTVEFNGDVYIEGITIVRDWATTEEVPKPKYPIHAINNGTVIVADCVLDDQLGVAAYGSDGENFGFTVLYGCTFYGGRAHGHGWERTEEKQVFAIVNCTTTESVGWTTYSEAADECWVVGGSVGAVKVDGSPNSILHLDPETVVDGAVQFDGTQDSRTDWPVPVGGVSDHWRAYYGLGPA